MQMFLAAGWVVLGDLPTLLVIYAVLERVVL